MQGRAVCLKFWPLVQSHAVQPARSATKSWTTVRSGRIRMPNFTRLPLCVRTSATFWIMLALSDTPRTDAQAKGACWVAACGLQPRRVYRVFWWHDPQKEFFLSLRPRNFGRLSMELKSKLHSLGQGCTALLAGGELLSKRGALAEARLEGLALSLLKAFCWKSTGQIRQGNGRFPSVRTPFMNSATSCEVAAFHVVASPLFVYQLASCSNVCLQRQGFLWQERRRRDIWWHRSDNCYIFEDGSPLHFLWHSHHSSPYIEVWTAPRAGGVSLWSMTCHYMQCGIVRIPAWKS